MPTDAETGPIAMQLADYNNATAKFLDMKLTLIKQNKLPFDAYEFHGRRPEGEDGSQTAKFNRRATFTGRAAFLQSLAAGNDQSAINESYVMEMAYHEQ